MSCARSMAAIVALTSAITACGSSGPTPVDAVQAYLATLAQGNYVNACAMLTPQARHSLTVGRRRVSCKAMYTHCLPSDPLSLKRDETQLLFGEVRPAITGRRADAKVSGTAVAREIRSVALVDHKGRWLIVSPGRALQACRFGRAGRRGG